MLKKTNRIKKNNDFDKIFREGRRINGDFLTLKVVKNNTDESRFGFVISKKISNKATTRNKLKRILGEITRENLFRVKKGIDIVFIVKKDFSQMKFSDVGKFIELILEKESLLAKGYNNKQ